MTLTDKLEKVVTVMDATECFAVPGEDSLIDCINPATDRTWIYGQTLEQIRERYPNAERMNIDDWSKAKAARQDTVIEWLEVTQERYHDMMNVLPPACYGRSVEGFLVGEPWDHHAATGAPRFAALIHKGAKYYESSRPLTVKEFRHV